MEICSTVLELVTGVHTDRRGSDFNRRSAGLGTRLKLSAGRTKHIGGSYATRGLMIAGLDNEEFGMFYILHTLPTAQEFKKLNLKLQLSALFSEESTEMQNSRKTVIMG